VRVLPLKIDAFIILVKQKAVSKPIPDTNSGPVAASCLICNAEFPSKTKLFEHIKQTGHAALKENAPAKSASKKKK
jgi:DnaJ family protein A protein 5